MIRGNLGIGGCTGLKAGPKGDGVKLKSIYLAPLCAGQKTVASLLAADNHGIRMNHGSKNIHYWNKSQVSKARPRIA